MSILPTTPNKVQHLHSLSGKSNSIFDIVLIISEEVQMNFLLAISLLISLCARIGTASSNALLKPQGDSFKKILRISTKHFAPYIYHDDKQHFYGGMEFELLQAIANRLNMSLSFQTTSQRSDICNNVALK